MKNQDIKVVEKIKDYYSPHAKEISKIDELKILDKKVRMPALVFAYVFGIIGTLILGVGMCFALEVLANNLMILGIAIGAVGIIMMSINYSIYKAILNKRKEKYSDVIIEKSNEILEK